MNAQLQELLNRKMDRKQFLKNVGAGFTAVAGFGLIMRALQPQQSPGGDNGGAMAYGSSSYGGNARPQSSTSFSANTKVLR